MEWLAQQQDLSAGNPSQEAEKTRDAALKLEDTIHVNHLTQHSPATYVFNNFSLSSSGAVGIVYPLGYPSLSVIYPGSNHPVQVLSNAGRYYWSAIFMKNLGKECLAAACYTDNTIHLWNLEDNTSNIVYTEKEGQGQLMNLCVIDDRTVAYEELAPSGEDGSKMIYILMTDTQPWSLSGTLVVRGVERIHDMCYMKTADGAACLLLNCPIDYSVPDAVEIVGWRIK